MTEETAFWRQLKWMSLGRGIRRIAVNKAEGFLVARPLLSNYRFFF